MTKPTEFKEVDWPCAAEKNCQLAVQSDQVWRAGASCRRLVGNASALRALLPLRQWSWKSRAYARPRVLMFYVWALGPNPCPHALSNFEQKCIQQMPEVGGDICRNVVCFLCPSLLFQDAHEAPTTTPLVWWGFGDFNIWGRWRPFLVHVATPVSTCSGSTAH